VSEEEFARLMRADGKARASDQLFGKASELGYETHEAMLDALGRYHAITSDPQTSGVLDALTRPSDEPSSQTTPEPMTDERFNQLLDERLQARDAEQFQQRYAADQQVEDRLLSEMAQSEALKGIFGETSFDDAITGKGSPLAQGYATLLVQALMEQAEAVNGQFMPVTDPAKLAAAQQRVGEMFSAIKTQTILDLSQRAPGSLERPDEGQPVRPSEDDSGGFKSGRDLLEEMGEGAEAHAQQVLDRAAAEGLPASQQ
jgi:hypothetical protein